ncbi:MAG: hypothetical protein MJY72_02505 [Bacteroidales bacterium]|nr:hypothetical protein [Bacteroidales bacterium]
MNNDQDIRDLFQAAKPELSSSEDFLEKLCTKLDEVDAKTADRYTLEDVLEYKRAAERKYRRAIAAAFGIGLLAGITVILSMMFSPSVSLFPMLESLGLDTKEIGSVIESGKTLLPQIKLIIIAAIPLLSIAAGLFTIRSWQD